MEDHDSDITLPKATIQKLIKEALPQDMRCAGDSTDLLMDCCTGFVELVSAEANEAATAEGKSTITPEHVLTALDKAGFSEFLPEVRAAWDSFKDDAKAPKLAHRKTKAEEEGMTEAEQIALQQQLFAAARMRSQNMDAAAAAAVAAMYPASADGGEGTES